MRKGFFCGGHEIWLLNQNLRWKKIKWLTKNNKIGSKKFNILFYSIKFFEIHQMVSTKIENQFISKMSQNND